MTHAGKQYSQLWLKIPQVLKTLLFRSVYKALESFCSQEYNLKQHNSLLWCLQYMQTSWYPAEIQACCFSLHSQAWIISCSKGPGNQRGRRTISSWLQSTDLQGQGPKPHLMRWPSQGLCLLSPFLSTGTSKVVFWAECEIPTTNRPEFSSSNR